MQEKLARIEEDLNLSEAEFLMVAKEQNYDLFDLSLSLDLSFLISLFLDLSLSFFLSVVLVLIQSFQ